MADMNLLMIDDEERFLKTTQALLEKKGIKTFIATKGSEAMDMLDSEKIDVVILDVKMPGLDGIEVLKIIRKRYPLVAVILLTGHATAESAIEGMSLGAYDYLIKPCEISVLIAKATEAYEKIKAMYQKRKSEKIDRIIGHPLDLMGKDKGTF